jgi:tetratricopeptide (TPR) repeat protein
MKIPFGKDKTAPKAFDKVLNEYLDAAKNSPEDIRIHIKIAELYLKNNNRDKAISEYLYAANTYRGKKLFQIAISIYNHILSIDPGQTAVYMTLADIYHKNGFNGDAAATLEKLANYYQHNGLKDKAVEVLNKIIEIDPANAQFRQKVEKFYAGTESLTEEKPEAPATQPPDTAAGFFDLEAALESDSSYHLSSAAVNDSDAAASGDADGRQPYADIFTHIREDAEAAPEEAAPDVHYDMGMVQQRLGEIEEAVKEFEKAITYNQKVAQSYLQLARCCRTMNNPQQAESYLKQGLALDSLTEDEKKNLRNELQDMLKAKGGLLGFFKNLRAGKSTDTEKP